MFVHVKDYEINSKNHVFDMHDFVISQFRVLKLLEWIAYSK